LKGGNVSIVETLAKEILELYRSDTSRAEALIESCLERELRSSSDDEKLAAIERLIMQFHPSNVVSATGANPELYELSNLFSMFLGKKISDEYLLSKEFLEKLADSLNTLFNALNETVGIIDATLLGNEADPVTIKAIISSNICGNNNTESLLNYVDKIKKAFLIAQKAFKEAAQEKFKELLAELEPDRIATMASGHFAFGPFRKADLFSVYEERHKLCQEYLESGRLMEEMLRAFERISQRLYGAGMGASR
jgi:hypothetical protein